MARSILILGGARSGKSRFAQQLARQVAGDDVLFIATAEAGDDEMRERIAMHQRSRPESWSLLEAPTAVGEALNNANRAFGAVIVDCLTLLISNVMLAADDSVPAREVERQVDREVECLLAACVRAAGVVIIVSGEVGMGLVPDNPLGRFFRDLHGRANQRIAVECDAVYQMIAGIPLDVKALAGRSWQNENKGG